MMALQIRKALTLGIPCIVAFSIAYPAFSAQILNENKNCLAHFHLDKPSLTTEKFHQTWHGLVFKAICTSSCSLVISRETKPLARIELDDSHVSICDTETKESNINKSPKCIRDYQTYTRSVRISKGKGDLYTSEISISFSKAPDTNIRNRKLCVEPDAVDGPNLRSFLISLPSNTGKIYIRETDIERPNGISKPLYLLTEDKK